MQTLGLIGGMSWESSAVYYEIINREVQKRRGRFHSCQCLMYSVDFEQVETLQRQGNWQELDNLMVDAARRLERGGADLVVLCTNTMHKCAPAIEQDIGIPLLHIADAAAKAIKAQGLKKVGLLGTRFTMEQDFYKGRLAKKHGIEVIIPDDPGIEEVHRVIYEELVLGEIQRESRENYVDIIGKLVGRDAEGVILGCTEIPLLVKQGDVGVVVFDTTAIHAREAVEVVLGDIWK